MPPSTMRASFVVVKSKYALFLFIHRPFPSRSFIRCFLFAADYTTPPLHDPLLTRGFELVDIKMSMLCHPSLGGCTWPATVIPGLFVEFSYTLGSGVLGGGSMLVEHERWDFEIRENYAGKWIGLVF